MKSFLARTWSAVKVRFAAWLVKQSLRRPALAKLALRVAAGRLARRAGPALDDLRLTAQGLDRQIDELRADVARDQDGWEERLWLGQSLVQRKTYPEAIRELRTVLSLGDVPGEARIEARLWLARAYEYSGQFQAAREAYEVYVQNFPAIGALERRRIERRIADLGFQARKASPEERGIYR